MQTISPQDLVAEIIAQAGQRATAALLGRSRRC